MTGNAEERIYQITRIGYFLNTGSEVVAAEHKRERWGGTLEAEHERNSAL
jgi:hypothetical protein